MYGRLSFLVQNSRGNMSDKKKCYNKKLFALVHELLQ